jgi:hypothetical protein
MLAAPVGREEVSEGVRVGVVEPVALDERQSIRVRRLVELLRHNLLHTSLIVDDASCASQSGRVVPNEPREHDGVVQRRVGVPCADVGEASRVDRVGGHVPPEGVPDTEARRGAEEVTSKIRRGEDEVDLVARQRAEQDAPADLHRVRTGDTAVVVARDTGGRVQAELVEHVGVAGNVSDRDEDDVSDAHRWAGVRREGAQIESDSVVARGGHGQMILARQAKSVCRAGTPAPPARVSSRPPPRSRRRRREQCCCHDPVNRCHESPGRTTKAPP